MSTSRDASPPRSLVVADHDAETRETVRGFMVARGYEVESAVDADAAKWLLQRRRVDVLISDLGAQSGGLELLSFVQGATPETRTVALAATSALREREAALRLGAVRVLQKPLSLLELADAIALAADCEAGFHGWLHRLALVDVLQMYHHAGQSVSLHIRGEVEGEIGLVGGALVDARCGALAGQEALARMLAARRGTIESAVAHDCPRTITGAFDHVLLDSLRTLDESRREPSADSFDGLDLWLADSPALDRSALVAWQQEEAPGASLWVIDTAGVGIDRLDRPGDSPELEMAGTSGLIGWAYELAEAADEGWKRIELSSGATAVGLVRTENATFALARVVLGDGVRSRFQLECARLARWLSQQRDGSL